MKVKIKVMQGPAEGKYWLEDRMGCTPRLDQAFIYDLKELQTWMKILLLKRAIRLVYVWE